MALRQEFLELSVQAVADAVVAGSFTVVEAGESVVPVLINDCAAGTQLDTLTGKKLDSELAPGQDLEIVVGQTVFWVDAGEFHHALQH